jgi:hypothetical protein
MSIRGPSRIDASSEICAAGTKQNPKMRYYSTGRKIKPKNTFPH